MITNRQYFKNFLANFKFHFLIYRDLLIIGEILFLLENSLIIKFQGFKGQKNICRSAKGAQFPATNSFDSQYLKKLINFEIL